MTDVQQTPGTEDVESFLGAVPGERRRNDARVLCDLMRGVTFVVGFSPRKSGAAQ